MASHVVVIDSSLKRTTIKTTPTKHLSDVLEEACSKLGLNAQNYTLKHGNKQLDLSRTFRLSGLSGGAKLSLVQASRSPSVVTVALQLPTYGDASGNLARLTDKFPSNTSIWQILRRFEAGATGSNASNSSSTTHNFTQRATPLVADGRSSGSGRLCYEMPVVNIMNRELASLADLQKTLSQLGVSSGNCLLRLSFRNTQQPLEDAMTEISQYFSERTEPAASSSQPTANDQSMSEAPPLPESSSETNGTTLSPPQPEETSTATLPEPTSSQPSSFSNLTESNPLPSASQQKPPSEIAIFAPPSSTAPAASQVQHDENDYIPSIEQAQLHQASLSVQSRNKKLLSNDELAAQEEVRSAALNTIKEVVVRFRFPDQSQAQRSFGQDATTADLYEMCKEVMDRQENEEFYIRVNRTKGATETVPEGSAKLIRGLGWQGRVLLTVIWGDSVSSSRRRKPCLKEQYREKAEAIKVDLPENSNESADASSSKQANTAQQGKSQGAASGAKDVETKLRGFLKGLSKK